MIGKIKISAVVPVYNECPHLDVVIKNIVKLKYFDEIICINDGSTDDSLKVLEKYNNKVNIITYEKNGGKGFAVAQGIKLAKGDIVVLLDADIYNYSNKEMFDLISPLIKGEVDFTLRAINSKFRNFFVRPVSGIRAYWRKDISPLIKKLENSTKYGIEPILNYELRKKNGKSVWFNDSEHIMKFAKYDAKGVMVEYWKEGKSLAQEYWKILKDIEIF